MVDRHAYVQCGGHTAIRGNIHDGLALPKAFRAAGFRTDLVDVTEFCTCRMYRRDADVWSGLSKNTHEGLGAPARILPFTLLLMLGQVVPFVFLASGRWMFFAAAALALLPRVLALRQFHQPILGVVLHPFAIVALLAIQWAGLLRWYTGRPVQWKQRAAFSRRGTHEVKEASERPIDSVARQPL
jgi:hypothetical protein